MRKRPTGPCSRPGCTNQAVYIASGLCEKHHAYMRAHGTLPPLPADLVDAPTAHVHALLAQGYTVGNIAATAGVSFGAVRKTERGDGPVYRHIHDAIVNADMDTAPHIPAWRATRRVRALAAAGHRMSTIAAETGITPCIVHDIAAGKRRTVTQTTWARLTPYWDAHKDDPVTTPDPRVAAYGWAAPWEWDDIDDPDTDLHGDKMVDGTTTRAAIERAITRYGIRRTAEIVGCSRDALCKAREYKQVHQSRRAHILRALNLHEHNMNRPTRQDTAA